MSTSDQKKFDNNVTKQQLERRRNDSMIALHNFIHILALQNGLRLFWSKKFNLFLIADRQRAIFCAIFYQLFGLATKTAVSMRLLRAKQKPQIDSIAPKVSQQVLNMKFNINFTWLMRHEFLSRFKVSSKRPTKSWMTFDRRQSPKKIVNNFIFNLTDFFEDLFRKIFFSILIAESNWHLQLHVKFSRFVFINKTPLSTWKIARAIIAFPVPRVINIWVVQAASEK